MTIIASVPIYKYAVVVVFFHIVFNNSSSSSTMTETANFIHLKYGIDKRMEVMKLDSRYFTTARDVLESVKHKFEHCVIHLYNEHGVALMLDDVIEKARVYTIKRQPSS